MLFSKLILISIPLSFFFNSSFDIDPFWLGISIKVIDYSGNEKEIKKKEIKFHYRGTDIPNDYIILSAVLKGSVSSKTLIATKQKKLIEQKRQSKQL